MEKKLVTTRQQRHVKRFQVCSIINLSILIFDYNIELSGTPAKIRNLKVTKEKQELDKPYNKTTLVTWSLPCRSNARIEKFIVKFLRNKDQQYDEDIFEQVVNVIDDREDYEVDSKNLSADSSYKVSVWAFANNERGEEEFGVFQIEAGCNYL